MQRNQTEMTATDSAVVFGLCEDIECRERKILQNLENIERRIEHSNLWRNAIRGKGILLSE